MKLINNILYIEFAEMVKCGVSENTLKWAKKNSSQSWSFLKDPDDGRKVLIEYEGLKQKYKDRVRKELCNNISPYEFLSFEIITPLLEDKTEDVDFLLKYTLSSGHKLPQIHFNKYREACKYLYLLDRLTKNDINKLGFKTIPEFYNALTSLIKNKNIELPYSYSRLKLKLKDYKKQGAECVISGKLCNNNSRKVDDVQKTLIKELFAKANQFNAEQIAIVYNKKAKELGWQTITGQTILNNKTDIDATSFREGVQVWNNANSFIKHRVRPSRPGMLWIGDGTPFELLYKTTVKNAKGHNIAKHWKRKIVYVVIDAFNDCVMGFAIGNSENVELTKQAWKNASLWTGILPQQIKTDQFARSELFPFYEKIALNPDFFTPASVGNARDKVIEPFFGRLRTQILKFYDNHSGGNITAKQQPNREYLDKIKNKFPNEEQVLEQIAQSIYIWNNVERKNGKSLLDDWKEGDHSQDRPLDNFKRLYCFGHQHTHQITLSNRGIVCTIGGIQRHYMRFDKKGVEMYYNTIGEKYDIIYDNEDYSKVLITAKDGRYKYILDEDVATPMAYGDFKEGDRKNLNKKLDFTDAIKNKVIEKSVERKKILAENGLADMLEAETLAQLMFTIDGQQKPLSYSAQNILKDFSNKNLAKEDDDDVDLLDPYGK